jgi:NAD(P)-dependent dehydrogenase (short-subunit alcohol dehydrogenase family)
MGKLDGKVAIITGGASGIGAASVRCFASEGARVVIADVQDERGARLSDELDGQAVYIHTDVSQESHVEQLIARTVEQFGRLDCMFNNAGIPGPDYAVAETPMDEFDRAMNVLLRGVFLGIKYAAPVLAEQKSGSIISTASVAGLRTGSGGHVYSAAKAAVIHLTRSVAMELGEQGVRVNCICPGGIATPIFGKAMGLSPEAADDTVRAMQLILSAAQPIQRAGLPEDVAQAALWLASDDASFVNGHALVVDGGLIGGSLWSQRQKGNQRVEAMFNKNKKQTS